jgi:hypothetical protein
MLYLISLYLDKIKRVIKRIIINTIFCALIWLTRVWWYQLANCVWFGSLSWSQFGSWGCGWLRATRVSCPGQLWCRTLVFRNKVPGSRCSVSKSGKSAPSQAAQLQSSSLLFLGFHTSISQCLHFNFRAFSKSKKMNACDHIRFLSFFSFFNTNRISCLLRNSLSAWSGCLNWSFLVF